MTQVTIEEATSAHTLHVYETCAAEEYVPRKS